VAQEKGLRTLLQGCRQAMRPASVYEAILRGFRKTGKQTLSGETEGKNRQNGGRNSFGAKGP